ncbi:MAG: hypothetical protein QM691_18395 [Opitutaceae bacterium]
MKPPVASVSRRAMVAVATIALTLLCLLPWWRNHDRLYDFNDYALVMSGVGRLDSGERAYVDFATPVQAGFLELSRLAEHLGGGGYLGLTSGAAALIVAGGAVLAFLLGRRWAPLPALATVAAVLLCTASQHTILWYNSLGAVCLIVAAWSAALAPAFSHRRLGWHLLLGAALLVGGMAKVTFQIAALGAVFCFCCREAWRHRETRGRAGALAGLALLCGVVLPVALELWITGASPRLWLHNVLQLAGHDRAAYLLSLADWRFYVTPRHDYYGALALPQVGAAVVVCFASVLLGGWAGRDKHDRLFLCLGVFGFCFVALALLAMNHEIAYVGLGTGIGLAVALALGFDVHPQRARARIAVAVPAVLVALVAGHSAWQGQRSLLGRPTIARSDYVRGGELDPKFHYIAGVRIPPELATSLQAVAESLPPADSAGRHPVLFTGGLEWLDRVWSPVRIPGLPLWYAQGTSAGEREDRILVQAITRPETLRHVYASLPWDFRTPKIDQLLLSHSDPPQLRGPFIRDYRLRTNRSTADTAFHRMSALGANYDPDLLVLAPETTVLREDPGRPLLGGRAGSCAFEFRGQAGRLTARALLRRSAATDAAAEAEAVFRIETQSEGEWHEVQSTTLTLAPGQPTVDWPCEFDPAKRPVRFLVTIAATSATVEAGWEAPLIVHGPEDDRPPPRLFTDAQDDDPQPDLGGRARLFSGLEPAQIITRGATLVAGEFALKPGGQLWLKPAQDFVSLAGIVRCLPSPEGETPVVRVLWCAGDRVQILDQFGLAPADGARRFRAWSAGRGGWIGVVVDPNYATGPTLLHLEQAASAQ